VSNVTTWTSVLTQRTTTAIPMRIVSIITVRTAASAEQALLVMAEVAETSTSVWSEESIVTIMPTVPTYKVLTPVIVLKDTQVTVRRLVKI